MDHRRFPIDVLHSDGIPVIFDDLRAYGILAVKRATTKLCGPTCSSFARHTVLSIAHRSTNSVFFLAFNFKFSFRRYRAQPERHEASPLRTRVSNYVTLKHI